MALNGLFCADAPLRNYSVTHSVDNSSSSSSSFIRRNKVRNIKLMKHAVGKTHQAHRALTVAFN